MAETLGSKSIGNIVKLRVDGEWRNFIVVHHGRPSNLYDSSFNNTTTLLMESPYSIPLLTLRPKTAINYAESEIHTYLNNNFYKLLDANLRTHLTEVKIPYSPRKPPNEVQSGSNGLAAKIWLLSIYETGITSTDFQVIPEDGSKLSYFINGTSSSALSRRICYSYSDGTATGWLLRSPYTMPPGTAATMRDICSIKASGEPGYAGAGLYPTTLRPALVMHSSQPVYELEYIYVNTAPSTPSKVSLPESVKGNIDFPISWSPSTDAENNLKGYLLEKKLDNNGWIKLYDGALTSTVDNIPYRTAETIQYRVKAYDNEGLESSWRNSAIKNIVNNEPPNIICPVAGDIGIKNQAFSIPYTIKDLDGDTVTVVETLDGMVHKTYNPILDAENSFNLSDAFYLTLLNGKHTITITANDSYGDSATHTISFTKSVTEIDMVLAAPLPADDIITKAVVNVSGTIPESVSYSVEACNNGFDSSPTWQDITASVRAGNRFLFTNTTKTAEKWGFNIRVRIDRKNATGECYLTAIGGNFE